MDSNSLYKSPTGETVEAFQLGVEPTPPWFADDDIELMSLIAIGTWIIRNSAGPHFVKPEIFVKQYEPL